MIQGVNPIWTLRRFLIIVISTRMERSGTEKESRLRLLGCTSIYQHIENIRGGRYLGDALYRDP